MQNRVNRLILLSAVALSWGLVAGCASLAKSYIWIHDSIDRTEEVFSSKSTPTTSTTTTSTTVPISVINDDPSCAVIVKYAGREPRNDGQVTYVKHVLTSRPFDRAHPVCVQYNDFEKGEVTVWKDQASRGERVDSLPADRGINKIVVWYE